ncbi:MAG: hypothetical protein SFV54_01175 [Bryobacteraceae bacterium]|nr:hypothetical protein [Bryobacteraceae bacterium]
MAFRSQTALALFLVVTASAANVRMEARHERWLRDRDGALLLNEEGFTFTGRKQTIASKWDDIQHAVLNERFLRVTTYEDVRWRLGTDREFEFRLKAGAPLAAARELLQTRLGQRLSLEVADSALQPLWSVRAKRLRPIRGAQGALEVGRDAIAFASETRGDSVTFRYADIRNLARVTPFEIVVTTLHDEHRFQLKEPLSEERFDDLWWRLQQHKGLKTLTLYQGDKQ